jgi:hypothetical protein
MTSIFITEKEGAGAAFCCPHLLDEEALHTSERIPKRCEGSKGHRQHDGDGTHCLEESDGNENILYAQLIVQSRSRSPGLRKLRVEGWRAPSA